MDITKKRMIMLSLSVAVLALSGCVSNSKISNLSGTYDADTFRKKYDPDPKVDYSKVKKKKYKKLNLPSGTYDTATFRALYNPDPNVDYGPILAKHNKTKRTSSSGISGALIDGVFLGILSASMTTSSMQMAQINFNGIRY